MIDATRAAVAIIPDGDRPGVLHDLATALRAPVVVVTGTDADATGHTMLFLDALDRFLKPFQGEVTWTRPQGGLFVWMTMPEEIDTGFDGPLFARCLAEGVIYVPGEFAFAPEPAPVPRNHMRLTFGVPDAETLVEGARRLAEAVCSVLSPSATA